MFGVDSIEFVIVAIAALLFIGPKELPGALRTLGRWVAKVRGMARHFQTGVDAMIREAELEEMEKQWRAENERIMAAYPMADPTAVESLPAEEPAPPLPPPAEEPDPRQVMLPLADPPAIDPAKRPLP